MSGLSLRDCGLSDEHFRLIRRLSFRADPIISSPPGLGCPAGDGRDGGGLRAGSPRRAPKGRTAVRRSARCRRRAHRDGIRARSGRLGLPLVPEHSVCGSAGGAVAVATTAAGGAMVGDAGRHQGRAAVHAGHRTQSAGRQADQRKLPDAQCLDSGPRTTQREAPGDGVDSRGRLRQRQRRHLSRALAGRQGPHRCRHDQLPVGCARFPGPPVARCARHGGQLRAGRPAGRAAMGPRQHRRVRRRSAEGDHRRRIRGRHVGVRSPGGAGVGRAVPRGDHPERAVSGAGRPGGRAAPERGLCDRGRLSQSRHHRAVSACAAGDPARASTLVLLHRRLRRALRAGHRNGCTAGQSDRGIGCRSGSPGSGADGGQPRRIHALRGVAGVEAGSGSQIR